MPGSTDDATLASPSPIQEKAAKVERTSSASSSSSSSAVGHVRPAHASAAKADVPQLKKFRKLPGALYFLSYASTGDLCLYLVGSLCALFSALPYSGLDLIYGHWTTGLVTPLPDGSPPGPTQIRAASREAALVMVGITFGMWIFPGGFFFCMSLASSRVVARIRRAYLSAVLAQDAVYFETIGPGEVASRLQKDIGLLQAGVGERLGFILWSVAGVVCGTIVALWASPRVGGVLFSILPAATLIFILSAKLSSRASDRMDKTEGEAASFLEQVISSIRIVKVFQAADPLVDVYDDRLKNIQRDGRYIALAKGVTYSGSYFFIFVCYALVFWYGGQRVACHGLDVGRLLTCFFSTFNAMFSIVNILPHITGLLDAIRAQRRIRTEIERSSSIDHRNGAGVTNFVSGEKKNGDNEGLEIELRNVTFAFPSRLNHKSLDGVSLTIPKGAVVALVGASGSGKSTIAALLLRQYDLPNPTSSTSNILIQSHSISSLSIPFLRSSIAIVSQEPQLLSGSILENVSVGLTGTAHELQIDRSNIDQVEALCKTALEAAQAWDFVQRLPQGMHTVLGGGKVSLLSGGQKQRIAVARALVRRPRILIMDEGTSALDSETEGRLQRAIAVEQRERGMTVILIAHRLSTVRDADKIIVMAAGKKLEEGTHESLVAARGAYHTMLQRHHGIVPSDQSIPASGNVSHPTEPALKHSELALDSIGAPAAPHHGPMAPPDLKHTASIHPATESLHRPVTRRGGTGYSHGMQQAEEALASGEQAEADSSTTRKDQYRRFFRYIGEQKRWVLTGLACALVIGSGFPITGYLTGLVVHALALDDPRAVSSETTRYAGYFFAIAMVILVLCFAEGWFLENGAQALSRRMRKRATDAILRQEVGYFDQEDNGAGGLTSSIGTHPSQVSTVTGLISGQLTSSTANVIGSVILGLYLSWDLFLVSFSPIVLLVPVGLLEIVYFGKYESEGEKPMVKATSYASESIDAIKTISAFGREHYVVEEFDRLQQPNIKAHRRALALGSILFGLGQACIPFLISLIFYYGGVKYARGSITLVTLYAVFEAACIAAFSIGKTFSFIGDISRAVHSWRSFSKWIERVPLVAKIAPKAVGRGEKREERSGGAEIVFKKVELVYPTRKERPAIHELGLHIRPGEKVAFCGPSGGGKSSILGLLARFYESSRGTITVDGEDIRASPLEEHYSRIALVSQDAQLYEGTVAFNLTLGLTRPVDEEELRSACEQACILDFVLTLDDGFQAQIGMKGLALSGGQRQRLCIARALLRNARILLLDEATSALDNASESLVQQALDRASQGRTTITIAHRLSTIRDADRIYVLEDGRVVETGSHDELIRKNGRYVELVEAQL